MTVTQAVYGRYRECGAFMALLLVMAMPVSAAAASSPQTNAESLRDYTSLSLAELANVEVVTSVSRREQKLAEVPSAAFVITQEDIRRSGATSVPEALRMVPGINVARAGANDWAVSARGFNDQFANRLLVMVDGRTVYTNLFGGTFWDTQNFLMDDIDHIEVIRGPGGTVWGANAVNGVINIITKHSEETQGTLLKARVGNLDKLMTEARYGGKAGEHGTYRAYVRRNDVDEMRLANGEGAKDESLSHSAGFRSDFTVGEKTDSEAVKFSLQGDVYTLDQQQNYALPTNAAPFTGRLQRENTHQGANLLAKANKKDGNGGEYNLQASYDVELRDWHHLNSRIQTLDFDFTHSRPLGADGRHHVIWGAGYRNTDHAQNGTYTSFSPNTRNDNLFSAFLQDEYALLPETLYFTAGTKLEHNDYTGVEWQPSARLSWLVDDKNTLWTSVSRAVKVPARFAANGSLMLQTYQDGADTVLLTSTGNANLGVEDVIAYEVGYRTEITKQLQLDFSAFYNDYDNIIQSQILAPRPIFDPILGPVILQELTAGNSGAAKTYGFEAAAKYQATPDWQLSGGYSFLKMHLEGGAAFSAAEGKSPQQQFNLRSDYRITDNWDWNQSFYWVDQLQPAPGIEVPSYLRVDTRVAWRPVDGVELSVVGQNLLDNQHPEFSNFLYRPAVEIGRSVYAQASVQF